jgi:hypothetical protein
MTKSTIGLFILLLISGCSKWATLGLKEHDFDSKGDHIVWIQVAGLSPEHLAMLKFYDGGNTAPVSLENSSCLGSMWSYNLYDLRPKASEGFLSQTLGSKNIKGACSDIDRDPVWSFFQDTGYSVGAFFSQNIEKEKMNYLSCSKSSELFKDSWIWKREGKSKSQNTFHYQENILSEAPSIMSDKSCDNKGCVVPFSTHVKKVWSIFSKEKRKTFFVIRDNQFRSLLKKRKVLKARDRLREIDDLHRFFLKQSKKSKITIVVSSSSSLKVDFPRMGKDWARFEKNGKGFSHQSSSLNSGLWASGVGAENFCGIYNEAEVFKRFLWLPEGTLIQRFGF